MTIKSQPLDFAVSIIVVAGCAFGTCKSSTDIPVCSAIARASSSTLYADAVKAFAQLVTQQITDKTKFIWYHPAEIESYVEQQFKSEAAE